ncbi:hypothetical protein XFF6990_360003 [Xanthomonas citri pv. fuscans]|uniref:Uncharacterized protein n=1 Tax=Xanthomonas campestris pv. phaseoli TaxID=317013 RepID=A0A7Z7J2R8_XANCH|nr:hypothetical protein XFF6990_360003 [Xanthomonas citri pv. fuscans]SOO24927.1 hypothetical protein XFF6991_420144 [Xanthomonas phaseoli pv. phaseoli]
MQVWTSQSSFQQRLFATALPRLPRSPRLRYKTFVVSLGMAYLACLQARFKRFESCIRSAMHFGRTRSHMCFVVKAPEGSCNGFAKGCSRGAIRVLGRSTD